jgi:hypothetical protein
MNKKLILLVCASIWVSAHTEAQALSGTTGLFNIPSGRIEKDRTFLFGANFMDRKYGAYKYSKDADFEYDALATYATLVFLPRIEVQFRYTHLLGREISPKERYFPDRMATIRIQALRESKYCPALTVGLQDFAHALGNNLGLSSPSYYSANYVVASKNLPIGRLISDFTLGYAVSLRHAKHLNLDGAFGGLAVGWKRFPGTDFMLEYDSYRWNAAFRVLFFKRLQMLVGWYGMDAISGGLSWRVKL